MSKMNRLFNINKFKIFIYFNKNNIYIYLENKN